MKANQSNSPLWYNTGTLDTIDSNISSDFFQNLYFLKFIITVPYFIKNLVYMIFQNFKKTFNSLKISEFLFKRNSK